MMRATRDVIFRARDLSAVQRYYADVLGLRSVPTERATLIGFDAGDVTIYFEEGDPNGAVFEFVVADVQQAKTALVDAGCELVEEDEAIPRVYLRDRFGITFNLTQR